MGNTEIPGNLLAKLRIPGRLKAGKNKKIKNDNRKKTRMKRGNNGK